MCSFVQPTDVYYSVRNAVLSAGAIQRQDTECRSGGGARWAECGPLRQKVVGSIPGRDTNLGRGFDPPAGALYPRQLIDVSLSHQSLSLSLKSIKWITR